MERFVMVSGVAAVMAFVRDAAAQMTPPSVTPAPAPAAAGDNSGMLIALALMGAMLLLVGIGVKIWDARRKREAEAVHLQSQLSDALLREADFFGLAITPTVHAGHGKTARVEVTGRAPSPTVRDAALRIVRDECLRVRPDCDIEDRIEIAPEAASRRIA
ncbi:MAG: hypothetical protein FJ027_11225 [Candidatus Rokubacteria bacterium]|nr:hypothetical protein [Candidatus Rokubacteria bacterium]